MTAPAPSAAEAAIIDRFGIFDEERIVDEVARAIQARLAYHRVVVRDSEASEAAVAAVAAYRAQDGGAEEFAAAVLRAAAQEQRNEAKNVPDTDEGTHADGHRCAAEFLDRRAAHLDTP